MFVVGTTVVIIGEANFELARIQCGMHKGKYIVLDLASKLNTNPIPAFFRSISNVCLLERSHGN